MRIHIPSTACDVISFNISSNLCRRKRSFNPYQNEHNSVKEAQEKGKTLSNVGRKMPIDWKQSPFITRAYARGGKWSCEEWGQKPEQRNAKKLQWDLWFGDLLLFTPPPLTAPSFLTIGPLQLAVVQNRHAGEQKSHWDKTNKGNYHLKLCLPFVYHVPVRLLLSSMAVLYHMNGTYWHHFAFFFL